MATTVVSPLEARARRISLISVAASDVAAVAVLTGLCAALAALTWNTWGDVGQDTGYDLVAGALVAHGQVPYAEFTYYYGPLAPLALGLAALLGGSGLAPAVWLGLVLTAAVLAGTYALARTQIGPWGSVLASAIVAALAFAPTNLSYVLPHSLSATLAVLLSIAFLLGVHRYAATRRTIWLVATGLAAGGVALTRPEFETAVGLAAVVWLALRAHGGLGWRREAAVVLGFAVTVPAVVYGLFLTRMSVHALLFDNLYPVRVLRAGGNHVLRIDAPLTASSIAGLGGKLVVYAVGAAVLIGLGSLAVSRSTLRRMLATAAGAVAVAAALLDPEAVRTGLQYAYGWIPLGAVLVAIGLVVRRVQKRAVWSASQQVYAANAIVLAVLAMKTYAAFFFESTNAQPAVYAAPFAAVFLARLHMRDLAVRRGAALAGAAWLAFLAAVGIGLTIKDAHAKSARLTGPGGTIAVSPGEAPMYRSALREILNRTRPGDAVLVAPQLTLLYTLSGRSDPLPQISLLPGALGAAAGERAAITRLQRSGVRLAIIDRVRLTEYGQTSFGRSYDRILGNWIHHNFVRIATLSPASGRSEHVLDVLVRRSS